MRQETAFSNHWNASNSSENMPDSEVEKQKILELFLPKIAARYTGRREIIHTAAVTKTVEEEQVEKTPVEWIYEKDAGPIWWLWLLLGVSVLLGMLPRFGLDVGFPIEWLGILGGGIFIALRRRFRTVRRQTVTKYRDTVKKVPREIVITPKSCEERLVPGHLEVAAIGRLSLPFTVIELFQGNLLLAPEVATDSCEQLEYPEIQAADELKNALKDLNEKTSRFPCILGIHYGNSGNANARLENQGVVLRGMEHDLNQSYLKVAQLARDIKRAQFRFTAVPENHPLIPMLRPASRTWPEELFLQGRSLEKKLHGDDGEDFDRMLAKVSSNWPEKQLLMHAARLNSLTDGIAPFCRQAGQMFESSAFDFYCPACAADQQRDLLKRDYSVHAGGDSPPPLYLPNTRCVYDPNRENWHCLACGSETLHPIRVHRMLDELLLPAFDRLMEENKDERLRIYSRARERERQLQNQLKTEVEELIRKNRESVESLRTDKQHNEAEVQGELRALIMLTDLRGNFDVDHSPAIQKIFAEQKDILRILEEEQSQVHESLDQIYESHRHGILERLSQLSRAEIVERKKRDELLSSTIQHLGRMAEAGPAHPQARDIGRSETTETSADPALEHQDLCAPKPARSPQSRLITDDALPTSAIDVSPLEFDVTAHASNVITEDTLPNSAIDVLPLEFDVGGPAKNVTVGAAVCLAGETQEPGLLENWRIENVSGKSI